MGENKPLPYRRLLPLLLTRTGMSYRELGKRTGKSASYWSQTLTGRVSVPQNPVVYEELARLFGRSPFSFAEYAPLLAARLVLEDPTAAYEVATGSTSGIPIRGLLGKNVSGSPGRSTAPWLPEADFVVVVRGDSLTSARLHDGDLVYLGAGPPREGDLVLSRRGDSWLLGFFYPLGGTFEIRLSSNGPAVPDWQPDSVEGVEVGVLRSEHRD